MEPFWVAGRLSDRKGFNRNLDLEIGDVGRQLHVHREFLPPGSKDQPVDLSGRVAWSEPGVRGGHMCVGVEEMVISPVGHRVVHPQATVDRPEWYRSGDANDRDVLAVGAADTVDRGERADAVRHEQRAKAV